MNQDVKNKIPNMEDMQEHARKIANKAILNEGTCSTAAATAAKAVTLGTTFRLVTGAKILVTFTNGITVASPTLAVTYTDASGSSQTTAAKPIYYRGAALGAGLIKAGASVIMKYNTSANSGNGAWEIVGDLNVDSGFSLTEDNTNGLDVLAAIGNATITDDNTNGLDIMTF